MSAPDRAMLSRSVATIVAQVQAMTQLAAEFRDYARLPAARRLPSDRAAAGAGGRLRNTAYPKNDHAR